MIDQSDQHPLGLEDQQRYSIVLPNDTNYGRIDYKGRSRTHQSRTDTSTNLPDLVVLIDFFKFVQFTHLLSKGSNHLHPLKLLTRHRDHSVCNFTNLSEERIDNPRHDHNNGLKSHHPKTKRVGFRDWWSRPMMIETKDNNRLLSKRVRKNWLDPNPRTR